MSDKYPIIYPEASYNYDYGWGDALDYYLDEQRKDKEANRDPNYCYCQEPVLKKNHVCMQRKPEKSDMFYFCEVCKKERK